MMKKRWMLIPAMAGVLAIGGVAMADDSVPSVKKASEKTDLIAGGETGGYTKSERRHRNRNQVG